jgi:DNA-directed RNA polymerase subunit F
VNEENVIVIYNDLFLKTWHNMVSIVGIHTVKVLVQRSLWQTRQNYAEAELIQVTEEGIYFEELRELDPEKLKEMLEDFFSSLINILTRLVGEEISQKLAEGIDVFKK